MIKKATLFAVIISLVVLLSPIPAQAQGGLAVTGGSVKPGFPTNLQFNLSAQSNVNIVDIRLHYTVEAISFATVVSEADIDFAPATKVSVSWTWDMRRTGGLPPGTGINYWWTLTDAAGAHLETQSARVQFDDQRYSWQTLAQNMVTLYYYNGDKSFASELMSTAQQAISRLAQDTGAVLDRPVKIYIYRSAQDLQGAMINPQEWSGGVAYAQYGIIAIGIAPSNLTWGKRAMSHELAHLVVHQMTFNPYNELPTWLDEGLAMYAEGSPDPDMVSALNAGIAKKQLISVRSLASPFSAFPDQAVLSYAESDSLVRFLVSSYGQGKMLELLNTFKQGSTYDAAFQKVYGFDIDGLNSRWRDFVLSGTQPKQQAERSPAFAGALAVAGAVGLFMPGIVVENWAWRQ